MLDPERVWAIVPVKLLALAKSRLAPLLGRQEREELCLAMLEHVLGALETSQSIGRWVVVSPDDRILALATARRAQAVRDAGHDLNAALRQGAELATSGGAEATLLLPADLPLLKASELDALVELATEARCVAIAPASGDGGTNALLCRPPRLLQPLFGPNSFDAHRRQAQELGVPVHLFHAPGLDLDLDTPEALEAIESSDWAFGDGIQPPVNSHHPPAGGACHAER